MGRFIILHNTLDNDRWVIPSDLVKYDQRHPPWPNELFPHNLCIDSFEIQDNYIDIKIRRFCEQQCLGDVAVDKVYTSDGYKLIFQFWFELDIDCKLFGETWKLYILEAA